jgi:hypothetical protein
MRLPTAAHLLKQEVPDICIPLLLRQDYQVWIWVKELGGRCQECIWGRHGDVVLYFRPVCGAGPCSLGLLLLLPLLVLAAGC